MKWVCAFLFLAVSASAQNFTDTNLGEVGNERVKTAYDKYVAKQKGCDATGSGKRILMMGFGRWLDSSFNISGEVARSFLDETFWPARAWLPAMKSPLGELSKTPVTTFGASVGQRALKIDGKHYVVCSIYADVTWDLAAAIIVKEMDRFQPEVVLMSGRGFDNAVLEGAVSNLAVGMLGYDGEGGKQKLNVPWCAGRPCNDDEHSPVLPEEDSGVEPIIAFSWDNKLLAASSKSYFQNAFPGVTVLTPRTPSGNNDYLCNNVGYVAAHAAKGIPVRLAGGNLVLTAKMAKAPRVGFFHYPGGIEENADSVFAWAKVMASLWRNF